MDSSSPLSSLHCPREWRGRLSQLEGGSWFFSSRLDREGSLHTENVHSVNGPSPPIRGGIRQLDNVVVWGSLLDHPVGSSVLGHKLGGKTNLTETKPTLGLPAGMLEFKSPYPSEFVDAAETR